MSSHNTDHRILSREILELSLRDILTELFVKRKLGVKSSALSFDI